MWEPLSAARLRGLRACSGLSREGRSVGALGVALPCRTAAPGIWWAASKSGHLKLLVHSHRQMSLPPHADQGPGPPRGCLRAELHGLLFG